MLKINFLLASALGSALALNGVPAMAAYNYDFSSADGQDTSTPITIGPATFSSQGGASNAYTFSPNSGLYTSFGSEVLSEAGNVGTALNITFAAPQTDVTFDFSLGDFFGTNDPLTVTTNNGTVLTAIANAPSNGDFFPEGTFDLISAGGSPVTSISLSGAYPITIADMTSVSATPLPSSASMFMLGLLGLVGFTWLRRSQEGPSLT